MKTRSPARELRQAVRTLARAAPRTAHPLAAPQQPFDSLLLARSPLYRRSRERYLAQGGALEPALLSSPRSLAGAILLENRIQYSPIEAELVWTARDPRENPARLLDLRTYTTSLFHEQSHRLLWPLLPPPPLESASIRSYLNFVESLVVMADMALSDSLPPGLARSLSLVGSIYDPGTTIRRTLRSPRDYRRYLLAAMHATYLNLELYDPSDIERIIRALFGGDAPIRRAAARALNLDRQFVLGTNPVWQRRNRQAILAHFTAAARGRGTAPGSLLDLPDDPFQHGIASLWAERWLDEMKVR